MPAAFLAQVFAQQLPQFFRTHPRIDFVLAFEAIQNVGFGSFNQVMMYFESGKGLSAKTEDFLSNLHKHTEEILPYPSLKTMARMPARETQPRVFAVRNRTVANVDSNRVRSPDG
jgi:hypothetical protein